MQNETINNYINVCYERWKDYAVFHSTMQGIEDHASDILNEVLEAVLRKDESCLIDLYNQKNKITQVLTI